MPVFDRTEPTPVASAAQSFMVDKNRNEPAVGGGGGGGGTTTYHLRAYDTGTAGWVYWSSVDTINLSPGAGDTAPNYTGTLSAKMILAAVTS